MARSSRNARSTTARDVAEIERLLRDLEGRLSHLGKSVGSDARHAAGAGANMISEAVADLAARVRDAVGTSAHSMSEEAARVGHDAWHKIEDEVEHRPFAALAVAAGIGFLIGLLNRR